ncbi:MAG: HdeD family acid-resistance protein [Chloroflexi bacterium]|nr:HdeD family acid-resistance protein [Chloroflexota bacterium]
MLAGLARNWWLLAIRGIAAILFGIGAFLWPGLTLSVLILLVGAYALVDGLFALIAGVGARRWLMALEGLAGIILGVLTFVWPGITAFALLYFITTWSIITGIFEIAAAVQLRKAIDNEWMLILSGILSLLFGVILIVYPSTGALSLIWLIGAYAVLFGIVTLGLAFRLRSAHNGMGRQSMGTV